MKLFVSLFLTAYTAFCALPNATAGDEEVALLTKKFQDASKKYPRYKDTWLLRKEFQKAVEEYRDQTKGKSGICPIHKIQMSVREVPFTFGLLAGFGEIKKAKFPFSDEFIWGGCQKDDSLYPETGKLFVCPQCVAARNLWAGTEKKKLGDSKSK